MQTVRVAPGSYTLQLGGAGAVADVPPLGTCAPDQCIEQPNGPIAWGLPAWGWYDDAISWYDAQFINSGAITVYPMTPAATPAGAVPLDPYGSDAELKGLRDVTPPPTTFLGYNLSTLFTVGALAAGAVILYNVFKKKSK